MIAEQPVTTSVVLMTADEARACVDRIKSGVEEVAFLLLDLHEREGWRALGYTTWRACASAEFAMSQSRAYQLLNLATVNRILSTIVEKPLPEAQARELASRKDEPETVKAIYVEAAEVSGGTPTAAVLKEVAERHSPSPKPSRHGSSATSASDGFGDLPDDQVMGFSNEVSGLTADAVIGDEIVNQETYGAAPNAEHWCNDCGEHYRGPHACSMAATPPEDASAHEYPRASEQPCTTCGGEIMLLSEQDDRALATNLRAAMDVGQPLRALCDDCLIGEDEQVPVEPEPEPAPTTFAELRQRESEMPPGARTGTVVAACMAAALRLTSVDPASYVVGLSAEERALAQEQRQAVRKWFDDVDLASFQADLRAQRQGATV